MMTPVKIGAYCYIDAAADDKQKDAALQQLKKQVADLLFEDDSLYTKYATREVFGAINMAISVTVVPREDSPAAGRPICGSREED